MNNSNRNSTSSTSNINKRKHEFDAVNYKPPLPSKIPKSSGFKKPGFKPPPPVSNKPTAFNKPASTKPDLNNNKLLLAGYFAHEFLTKGTLFGEQLDEARAETGPSNSKQSISPKAEPSIKAAELKSRKRDRYVEVACLLKSDGVHIPGVVNPTQLGLFLHM